MMLPLRHTRIVSSSLCAGLLLMGIIGLASPSQAAAEEGWITLFDGTSLAGWHKNPMKIGHGTVPA